MRAVQELGADENRQQALLNAGVETALLAPFLIERQSPFQIASRHRTAERLLRHAGKDLTRARQLLCGALGAAREELATARRLTHALRIQRPLQLHALNARTVRVAVHVVRHADDRIEPVQDLVRLGGGLLQVGDSDPVRTGRHAGADVAEAVVDPAHARRLFHVHRGEILVPSEVLLEHLHIIDRDDEGVGIHHAPDVAGPDQTVDRELVVAIGRQVRFDEQATARPERQTLDVHVLPSLQRARENPAGRSCGRIADRFDTDLARRSEILLQEGRRNFQHVRDVVKTVRFVIARQQRRRIDLEIEDLGDRVGVLGPVQAM